MNGAGHGWRQSTPAAHAPSATRLGLGLLFVVFAVLVCWVPMAAAFSHGGTHHAGSHLLAPSAAHQATAVASEAKAASASTPVPASASSPEAAASTAVTPAPATAGASTDAPGQLVLFTALYTSLAMLLFIGAGMYAALRDRQYLFYLGYVAATLAYLLARNEQVHLLPGFGWFVHLGQPGMYALGNVLAASMVVAARGFAGLSRVAPRLDRTLRFFPLAPALLVIVCLLGVGSSSGILRIVTTLDEFAAIGLAIAATAMAWRHQQRLALPMLLMWVVVLAATGLRALIAVGQVLDDLWKPFVDQVALVLNALVMGMALTDHVIEFRLQRDRASLAKEQADASLKIERERLKFFEALHTTLRDAPSGDQEWLAFRRLLEVVRELVPQASSAVAVHAFQDADLLLCEPNANDNRESYQRLLTTRSGAFKGISRSQLPMQLRVDAPASVDGSAAELIQVAVVPLPLTAPAWGMLLIERRGWQGFERDELAVAAELAQKATRAVEDAANDRVLRINAEFDALTAVFNRRTMDNRLAAYFKESMVRRSSLAILFADLDHLREINEVYGHAAGDQALRLLADVLKAHIGTAGVVGRYASDKFVAILPDFNPEQARRWSEAMRQDAMGRDVQIDTKTLRVGVSVGIASRLAEDADVGTIIDRVEKALAASKRGGRGTVQAPPVRGVTTAMPPR